MPATLAPDHPFQHITRDVNKIVEQMQKGYYNARPADTWTPNVNLYETETQYLVCVDLSGVDKEKIDVELVDNRLTVRGAREVPSYDEATQDPAATHAAERGRLKVHLMEIDHGWFLREVELPEDTRRDEIIANYRNGMLWIEIPKK